MDYLDDKEAFILMLEVSNPKYPRTVPEKYSREYCEKFYKLLITYIWIKRKDKRMVRLLDRLGYYLDPLFEKLGQIDFIIEIESK